MDIDLYLDAIIDKMPAIKAFDSIILKVEVRDCMREAINQALVLASEKAKVEQHYLEKSDIWLCTHSVDKQSILDTEKLIV